MRYTLIAIAAFSFWILIHYTISEFHLAYQALAWHPQEGATNIILDHPWLQKWYHSDAAGGAGRLDPSLILPLVWPRIVYTCALFLFVCAAFAAAIIWRHNRVQKDRLQSLGNLNNQLHLKQEEARQGRQALVSLNDDLRLARLEAEGLAKKLSRLNVSLASRNSEMERFIYTISHDLRAPLVTVGGHIQLLARELTNENQLFRIERAQLSLNFMERLLEDLLLLSRTFHQDFSVETIQCEAAITSLTNVFAHQISDVDGHLEVNLNAKTVCCNPAQFSQAIQNLISNAIRYRDPGRHLVLEIDASETDTDTIITVRDNGIGIEPNHHSKVFEVFETLQEDGGTGVGLAIVKSIMVKHGGEIKLTSRPGIGSEFSLRFPKP